MFIPQLDLFDSVFEANGRKALLFYYQVADTPVSGELKIMCSYCTDWDNCLVPCLFLPLCGHPHS